MITPISPSDLFKKLNFTPHFDQVLKIYSDSDLSDLASYESRRSVFKKIHTAFKLLNYYIFHPSAFGTVIANQKYGAAHPQSSLSHTEPIRTCLLKSAVSAAFHPHKILEIGTYLGWGAAAFKKSSPKAEVYSINPSLPTWANDSISQSDVGSFYRKKQLQVIQLWGDSADYDFSRLSPFDVVFIDGDHSYSHVLKDLQLAQRIATKAVIVDDYIPNPILCPPWTVYGYWTFDVTSAIDYYLHNNPGSFSSAYWILDSKLCLLIK